MIINWITVLIMGGIIGWLASIVMKRNASMGIFWNIIVGIVGSFIGRFLGQYVGLEASLDSPFDLKGLLVSLAGAIILLFIMNMIQRGRAR